jgi:MATE family multidrug resistance protein
LPGRLPRGMVPRPSEGGFPAMALAATASAADLPLREHVMRTLRLAGPVMLARAGLLVMISVDTIMCGRVGARELAYFGIALAPHMAFLLVGIGLLMGTVVVTAQTDGAGRPAECGRIWRLALANGAVFGSLFGLLLLPGEAILLALGQAPEISHGGGAVLVMFALGMPAILMFTATTFFLEGIGRSTPGMVVTGIANLLNFGLNYALMFGPWQLGAIGAALATSISRWFMFLALAGYVLAMRDRCRYGVGAPMAGHWRLERKLARLGWPIALSFGLEHGAFFAAATFAGWLGAVPLAAYQVVLNVMALIYMLAIGIATATAVRVGNAVGRRDRTGLARAGWVGLGLGIAVMLGLTPVLHGSSGAIARIYTTDAAVVAIAAPGLAIGAWILLTDASQGIMTGALRGAADIWACIGVQFVCFWLICIPACYLLAHPLGLGVPGLLWGLFVGLFVAALLLSWRFKVLAAREVRPF